LQGLPVPVPAFHGVFACPQAGGTCLVLQYLEAGIRVSKLPVPDAMPAAAAWAGSFHAWNEERLRRLDFPVLTRHDTDYYVGWSRRTVRHAGAVLAEQPWLGTLCRRYEDRVSVLTSRSPTVIHGEYAPHNVLWHEEGIYPTDWESAALAAGEIDLAFLVQGWDEETINRCVQCYRQARGPSSATARFDEAFGVAQLYVLFRWLATRPEWPAEERSRVRLQRLKILAERTGILP
jgi:thiamine kinase-like enzyme